jgi:hypothetical protein
MTDQPTNNSISSAQEAFSLFRETIVSKIKEYKGIDESGNIWGRPRSTQDSTPQEKEQNILLEQDPQYYNLSAWWDKLVQLNPKVTDTESLTYMCEKYCELIYCNDQRFSRDIFAWFPFYHVLNRGHTDDEDLWTPHEEMLFVCIRNDSPYFGLVGYSKDYALETWCALTKFQVAEVISLEQVFEWHKAEYQRLVWMLSSTRRKTAEEQYDKHEKELGFDKPLVIDDQTEDENDDDCQMELDGFRMFYAYDPHGTPCLRIRFGEPQEGDEEEAEDSGDDEPNMDESAETTKTKYTEDVQADEELKAGVSVLLEKMREALEQKATQNLQ